MYIIVSVCIYTALVSEPRESRSLAATLLRNIVATQLGERQAALEIRTETSNSKVAPNSEKLGAIPQIRGQVDDFDRALLAQNLRI